ncbi:MAG TPA: Uma2 family endonuclease [Saprospiraceae bacterium]|nr:Uma2 family endonuclease [Saprospiraceae bacterium]HMP26235.1 Uma2 family endonuclease [Saprospiraceae bacterium]
MTIGAQKVTYRAFREMDFPDTDTFLYELLNGVIVRKSAPHIIHQRILRKLVRRFEDFVLEAGAGEVFFAPVDVVLSNENAPQPDLVFVSQANAAIIDEEEGIINGVPDLVVEIISPSSVKRDRIEKMAMYEQFKIKEYWLVDPNNQSIEIYTLKDDKYALHAFADATEKVQSVVLAGLEVDAAVVF